MPISFRVDTTSGPVATSNTSSGISLERSVNNRGFSPFAVDSVLAATSGSTFDAGVCGVTTLSASTALTGVLPKASDVPGATLIFRNLCTNAMLLTSSQETAGSKVFITNCTGALPVGNSALLRLPGTVGAAVVLQSDGANFHVLSYSGSVTLT